MLIVVYTQQDERHANVRPRRRAGFRLGGLAGVVFVADDLVSWLIGMLADTGRKKLANLIHGTDQERELRAAATAAIERTAAELSPGDDERAAELAMVVDHVFRESVRPEQLAVRQTLLEALGAGIATQIAVLDDADLTETGQSSADVLEVSGTAVATALTNHLLREIVTRGTRSQALFPLASQLNDDVTHLQSQQVEGMLGQVLSRLARIDAIGDATAVPIALAQLPTVTSGFTGREDELEVLSELLDPVSASGPVLVSAVAGLPGVGKTTLAVAAGHVAIEQGWFGGGALFIDLHGYDDRPVEPAQALDALLRSLGVPDKDIPPTLDERAALYRSALAQANEPILVVVDNASAEAQVKPLLPGSGPHKVMVTSRHTLAGLGARLVDVTVLDENASIALLNTALRQARPSDDRITADPDMSTRLATVCGGLPLALQIIAALLIADPALTTSEMAGELGAESAWLDLLIYDDGSASSTSSVTKAFDLSYGKLDETTARMLRLLPVNPGTDISTAAAAALADLPVTQTRAVLGTLARAHLAEPASGSSGRWVLHDLIRLYATRLGDDHADADSREQARDRLLYHYLDTADTADARLSAPRDMAVPEQFADRDDALTWLDSERASLIAAVTMAAATGRDQAAKWLPLILANYLNQRHLIDDWLAVTKISLDAARRVGDRQCEGHALSNLGSALIEADRYDEAIPTCASAAAICEEAGDRYGEANALTGLGEALYEVGRFADAITACQDAGAIWRDIGDRYGEARTLNNLGLTLRGAGRFDEAITAHEDAAAIFGEIGEEILGSVVLTNAKVTRDVQRSSAIRH